MSVSVESLSQPYSPSTHNNKYYVEIDPSTTIDSFKAQIVDSPTFRSLLDKKHNERLQQLPDKMTVKQLLLERQHDKFQISHLEVECDVYKQMIETLLNQTAATNDVRTLQEENEQLKKINNNLEHKIIIMNQIMDKLKSQLITEEETTVNYMARYKYFENLTLSLQKEHTSSLKSFDDLLEQIHFLKDDLQVYYDIIINLMDENMALTNDINDLHAQNEADKQAFMLDNRLEKLKHFIQNKFKKQDE